MPRLHAIIKRSIGVQRRPVRASGWAPAALLILLVIALSGGCGQRRGEVFTPIDPPIAWPPPPDVARIRYVGSLSTSGDLKPGKSMFKALGEAIFGKDEVYAMLSPLAVCTDHGQRVFVVDSNAQCVHVFDLDSRAYAQWRPGGVTIDGKMRPGRSTTLVHDAFSQPVGAVFDPRGRLLVSDSVAGVIFVFDSTGQCTGEIGAGLLSRPCGLAFDVTRDRLLVADCGLHQVLALDGEGRLLARVGSRGVALGQFNYPTNVAVDSVGRVFVSDTLNFRVQVFDSQYQPLRQIGRQGDMPGYFAQPKGLALDSENHLYVIDAQFEAVQVFDTDGRLLLNFGEEGHGPGQFWLPAGMAIDSNDRIWIADSYNQRVQVLEYQPEAQP
jgi:sugar lactone lactonase YvrE